MSRLVEPGRPVLLKPRSHHRRASLRWLCRTALHVVGYCSSVMPEILRLFIGLVVEVLEWKKPQITNENHESCTNHVFESNYDRVTNFSSDHWTQESQMIFLLFLHSKIVVLVLKI